jgi:hypothetical protein
MQRGVLYAQENRIGFTPVDVDLGVIDRAGDAMLVTQHITIHQKFSVPRCAAGQRTADGVDPVTGNVQSPQLFQRIHRPRHKISCIAASGPALIISVHFDVKVAEQYLTGAAVAISGMAIIMFAPRPA